MSNAFEDQLMQWLLEDAPGDMPNRVLDATFATTSTLGQDRRLPGIVTRRGRRSRVLLVATAVLAATMAVSVLVGALLSTRSEEAPDLLERVQAAGVLRVAVRPDHPQVLTPGVGLDGFDIDVADEIGSRLVAVVEIVPLNTSAVFSPTEVDRWDIALPSVAATSIDSSRFESSLPYYSWPHFLLVGASTSASSLQDLAGQPVCVVLGDQGEAWLATMTAAGSAYEVVVRESDDECLDALASGEVAGVVTARIGPADLEVHPAFRAVRGPPAEQRTIVASLRQNPFTLIARIDEVVRELRGDGTLERLSSNRFGGVDLTLPQDQ